MFCQNCGEKIDDEAKFCPSCGTPAVSAVNIDQAQPSVYPMSGVSSNQNTNNTQENKMANTAFVLGIISLIAWLIPFIGLPVSIIGLILSNKAQKSSNDGKAKQGLKMSITGLVLSIINFVVGMLLLI